MNVTLSPSTPNGKLKAIASKSAAHRALICAAFADQSTEIVCEETNEDINATVRCLNALGAKITRTNTGFIVLPIKVPTCSATLDCGESGSTLRFLLPVVCALGIDAKLEMSGRLPERPLSPLREELEAHGAIFSDRGSNPLSVKGKINSGKYRIRGNVSSQFISGLLFALSLTEGESTLTIEGQPESISYINMTLKALYDFGADISFESGKFIIHGQKSLKSPKNIAIEGDWSNAAFPLCAGAIASKGNVSVVALDADSLQGDRAILEILVRFGADVRRKGDKITVRNGDMCGINIDASNIPDLVPIIAVTALAAHGKTVIRGASRLRIKESDRLAAITETLSSLGADITETNDGLIINGGARLKGGVVSSCFDHRIAMSTAVASLLCDGDVTITDADAVSKSYPAFWEDIASIGFNITKN